VLKLINKEGRDDGDLCIGSKELLHFAQGNATATHYENGTPHQVQVHWKLHRGRLSNT
jgi:hypothetical protein